MVVGVCGLGFTGSGAVIDLLKEFQDIQIQDGDEFGITYRPDGLEDLSYHLLSKRSRYMSCDVAIYRFKKYVQRLFGPRTSLGRGISETVMKLTDEYISDICQVTWFGTWGFDAYYHSRLYNSIKGHFALPLVAKLEKRISITGYPYRKMYLSISPKDYYERTRQYVSDLIKVMGYDENKVLVMNQLFAGDSPQSSFPFFNNPKAIIVDKDPRDLYFLGKFEVHNQCAWMPTNDVESFIKYYKTIRSSLKMQDNNILYVRFENLVYEYKSTISKIIDFLNLSETKHIESLKYFNPNLSKNNTQLFRKYPAFKEETHRIEEELSDWLFPYDRYETLIKFGRSF